jgi:hypothetical protein
MKDNSTGKDKEFYALGKKMFDRLNPITQDVTQIPQEHSSKRQPLTDKQILADETLRYYFGQNGDREMTTKHKIGCVQHDCDECQARLAQPEQEPWLLESTQTLAKTLAREFYPEVTQWECLNDLAGVISQIDHMTTGLMRKTKQEPVGQLQEEAYGRGQVLWFKKLADRSMLYTSPPQREWVGLTDDEIAAISEKCGLMDEQWTDVMMAVEAKLKKKNT